jgi:hypothetical protein
MCRLSWNLGASTSWNPQGLSRPVMRLLCFTQVNIMLEIWLLFLSTLGPLKRVERTALTVVCNEWHTYQLFDIAGHASSYKESLTASPNYLSCNLKKVYKSGSLYNNANYKQKKCKKRACRTLSQFTVTSIWVGGTQETDRGTLTRFRTAYLPPTSLVHRHVSTCKTPPGARTKSVTES